MRGVMWRLCALLPMLWPLAAGAADRISILDFAPPGTQVDRTGQADASAR